MKNKKNIKGQTLVEFVLILPVALLLLIGFFDLGRAVFYYSSLTNAVREWTRHAIVDRELDEAMIRDELAGFAFGIDPEDITINIDYFPENEPEKTNISIEAIYLFQPITPMIASLLGNPAGIELVTQSNMRISGAFR